MLFVAIAFHCAPILSATQSFVVTVVPLTTPVLSTASPTAGQLIVQINGANGPEHKIKALFRLYVRDTNCWTALFAMRVAQ